MAPSPDVFQELAESWPSTLVARAEVSRFSGGVLNPRTLANADARGEGPAGKFLVGRKAVYPKAALVDWLRGRATA